ncbi:MAG: DUF2497 domain-containing protein, partial [Rhizomicrobium sp.]
IRSEPAKPELAKPELAKPELEVLELTQEIVENPRPQPEPDREAKPAPEPAGAPKSEEIVFEPAPRREPEPANDGIFSAETRKAMEETFAAIDEVEEPGEAAPIPARPSPDGTSVEGVFERAVKESFVPILENYLSQNSQIVVERMKPLIREWMDENFPALLENAVKGEVERIVKARSRR